MRSLVGVLWTVVAVMLLVPQVALAWGEIRVVTTDLNVRASRGTDAPKITTLKKGQKVKVDFIQGKWAAVFPMDATERHESKAIGFAGIRHLQYVGPAPETAPEKELVVEVKPEPAPEKTQQPASVVRQTDNEVVAKAQEHVDEMDAAQSGGNKGPVKITSDRMVYNEAKRTVIFEGSVRADHQDLTLLSETLTAHIAENARDRQGEGQIERIVAGGGVKATRGSTVGTCNTLTYMVQTGILRMEGNPELTDGENVITGEVIRFFLKDNRSEVVGSKKQRVKAVFSAPGDLKP